MILAIYTIFDAGIFVGVILLIVGSLLVTHYSKRFFLFNRWTNSCIFTHIIFSQTSFTRES